MIQGGVPPRFLRLMIAALAAAAVLIAAYWIVWFFVDRSWLATLDTGAYDFREPILLGLGRESLASHKPDDALAWLQLNVEFFPQSAASYVELSKAHLAKRDRDSAIADLTKAVALDPSNADAKRQLQTLRK